MSQKLDGYVSYVALCSIKIVSFFIPQYGSVGFINKKASKFSLNCINDFLLFEVFVLKDRCVYNVEKKFHCF